MAQRKKQAYQAGEEAGIRAAEEDVPVEQLWELAAHGARAFATQMKPATPREWACLALEYGSFFFFKACEQRLDDDRVRAVVLKSNWRCQ